MIQGCIDFIKTEDRLPMENETLIIYIPVAEVKYREARFRSGMFFTQGMTYHPYEVLCWAYAECIEAPKKGAER